MINKKLRSQIVFTFLFAWALSMNVACSSVQSGHFIKVKPQETADSLAAEFSTTKDELQKLNPDKEIREGEWIYVPLRRGLASTSSQSASSHSFDPNVLIGSGAFLWPVPASSTISSPYGYRWGKSHEGIDIRSKVGSNIVAANDGVVVYSGNRIGGYGNLTVIAHRGGFFSVYAHAKINLTKEGQKVSKGQVIAQIGLTGRTTGAHLHFEIRKNGESIDPTKYLTMN